MSEESEKPAAKRAAKRPRKPAAPEATPEPATQAAPEPQATISEPAQGAAPSTKRPKRRRGKKGKGGGNEARPAQAEISPPALDSTEPPEAHQECPPPRPQPPRPQPPRHDPEALAKKAWKIYLAEVSEEGIALINDNDARDIARRCFRLAAIFLDEQARA